MYPWYRRLATSFISCHLAGIGLASLPPPGPPSRRTVVEVLSTVHRFVWDVTAPMRRFSTRYVRATHLDQTWNMFAHPADGGEYGRVRYYVLRPSGGEPSLVDELVFPSLRDDEPKLWRSFEESFRDKAISNALEKFLISRERLMRRRPGTSELDVPATLAAMREYPPDDLLPVVRYFRNRYSATSLVKGERVVRTEFWYGVPESSRPMSVARGRATTRLEALDRYYDGPTFQLTARRYPEYGSTERESDLLWGLLYFQEAE